MEKSSVELSLWDESLPIDRVFSILQNHDLVKKLIISQKFGVTPGVEVVNKSWKKHKNKKDKNVCSFNSAVIGIIF